jgi:hypothetical protein
MEPVDAGPLRNARLPEPHVTLWIQLAFALGHRPDVAFRLERRNGGVLARGKPRRARGAVAGCEQGGALPGNE